MSRLATAGIPAQSVPWQAELIWARRGLQAGTASSPVKVVLNGQNTGRKS